MEAKLEFQSAPTLQRSRLREGRGFPLGATWTGLGVNFALFSAHATKVELCLFDEQGEREIADDPRPLASPPLIIIRIVPSVPA